MSEQLRESNVKYVCTLTENIKKNFNLEKFTSLCNFLEDKTYVIRCNDDYLGLYEALYIQSENMNDFMRAIDKEPAATLKVRYSANTDGSGEFVVRFEDLQNDIEDEGIKDIIRQHFDKAEILSELRICL